MVIDVSTGSQLYTLASAPAHSRTETRAKAYPNWVDFHFEGTGLGYEDYPRMPSNTLETMFRDFGLDPSDSGHAKMDIILAVILDRVENDESQQPVRYYLGDGNDSYVDEKVGNPMMWPSISGPNGEVISEPPDSDINYRNEAYRHHLREIWPGPEAIPEI